MKRMRDPIEVVLAPRNLGNDRAEPEHGRPALRPSIVGIESPRGASRCFPGRFLGFGR